MRKIYCLLYVLCVIVASASAQNISRIEYFFNTDPGFGNGTAITGFTPSADVSGFPASINVSLVPNGVNILYIRSKDDNGKWSITNRITFIKADVSTYNIVRAEYFFNTDPGIGKATPFTLPVSADISKQPLVINIESAPLGINNLYIRTEDSKGTWSLTNRTAFIKVATEGNISVLEYFIDADPGYGMATRVALTPGQDISNYTFNVDVSSLSANSVHNLFVRVKDANGVWSYTSVVSFTKTSGTGIGDISDASSAFTVFPNPATEKIVLQCPEDIKIDKIELMDVQGKVMLVQSSGDSAEKQIDISRFPEGIYFIKITSGKDVVYKKVVKN
jgi:hypothetical protein